MDDLAEIPGVATPRISHYKGLTPPNNKPEIVGFKSEICTDYSVHLPVDSYEYIDLYQSLLN